MAIRIDDFIAKLPEKDQQDIAKRTAKLVAEEATLRQIREARERSQAAVAAKLHIKQAAVSKLERRTDMYLSTLRGYIEAMGGTLEIIARFPGPGRADHAVRGPRPRAAHARVTRKRTGSKLTGRVDLGGLPPRSPTDPDVHAKGIRLVAWWRCRSHVPLACGDTLGGPMPSARSRLLVHNAAPPSLHGVREGRAESGPSRRPSRGQAKSGPSRGQGQVGVKGQVGARHGYLFLRFPPDGGGRPVWRPASLRNGSVPGRPRCRGWVRGPWSVVSGPWSVVSGQ